MFDLVKHAKDVDCSLETKRRSSGLSQYFADKNIDSQTQPRTCFRSERLILIRIVMLSDSITLHNI